MLRIITGLALIVAFVALLYDAAQTVSQGHLVTTSLGQTWFNLHSGSLNMTQVILERYVWPPLWNPGVVTVLQYPTWLVFIILAFVLGFVARIARL